MSETSERLSELEMRHAEQERVIEELSGEIARQWGVIERLERRLEGLAGRFMSLEEAIPPAPLTKPPHW
ncbi:SlyX family protein [Mesorhizobium sp. RP14(2022)]|uniref:Protein SlyX homolog n=1 Tax=Mesorhizobium liriopis TaxID=2953882 RepID=A0ABT1C3A1_9HYPH|nr:SlyX family protein [Mesorhizobium liriopis]MCO6049301.1 SlyX family protein [Mesorhizobium liriopis]